jgi:hypothetical protein
MNVAVPTILWNPDYVYELELASRLNFKLFDDNVEVINGPTTHDFKNDYRKKIVIKNWWLFTGTSQPTEDLSWADLIICYTSELINGPWEHYYKRTVDQFNNKNFICISNGIYNLHSYPDALVYDNLGHFFSKIVDVCRYQEWHTYDHKPKLFDALFGLAKPHRVFVFEKLIEFDLLDQTFVNLHGIVNYSSPDLIEYDDPKITQHSRSNSMSSLPGMANGIGVSHSIPFKIYQNSWYSIVAETNSNWSNFLTEKTAKPLFEKKLFVLFGSQGLLKRLHDQGYKTFHDVIDESYDQEPDDNLRWSMAFAQVVKLSTANHIELYQQLQPILQHNHQHICNQHSRLTGLKNFLQPHLNSL